MRYLSICSGIEAATVAWRPLGWECVGVSEIEKFPCAVLKHHYPAVPNYGDMTMYKDWSINGTIDFLVGGTPCQSFSVAGLRKGLADPRGNLALVYLGILDHFRPRWMVWENVPGVLSSNGGRDFGSFLGGLAQLGYGFAYRVLDAQFFGVPQRRRRVFVVGYLGDWRPPAAVLFERESLSGNPAPRREKGQKVAGTIKGGSGERGYPDPSDGNGGGLVQVANCLRAKANDPHRPDTGNYVCFENHPNDSRITESGDLCPTISSRAGTGGGNLPLVMAHGQGNAEVVRDGDPSLTCNHEAPIVIQGGGTTSLNSNGDGFSEDGICYTLNNVDQHAVCFNNRQDPVVSGDKAQPIGSKDNGLAILMRNREGCAGGGKGPLLSPDVSLTLAAETNDQVLFQSIGESDGNAIEADSASVLSVLRREIGEEAFAEWGLGILNSLQSSEILRESLHGLELRQATFSRCWLVYCALSCPKGSPEGALYSLREARGEGCASQGWQPSQQLLGELGAYMSELPQPGPQAERFMQDLWYASEGLGVLRQALSAIQKVRQSSRGENKSAYSGSIVRRLTVQECEFLQGFPRNYTKLNDKTPDGPRYKALGNSMAVPVMSWIGKRLEEVEGII